MSLFRSCDLVLAGKKTFVKSKHSAHQDHHCDVAAARIASDHMPPPLAFKNEVASCGMMSIYATMC